jgi:hypothetical protein
VSIGALAALVIVWLRGGMRHSFRPDQAGS